MQSFSVSTGLPYEGYAEILMYGLLWLLMQAVMLAVIRPSEEFAVEGFVLALITSVMPFVADPLDSLKDALFSTIALSGDFLSQIIGVVSLMWLWFFHLYMLRDSDLQLELRGAYLSVLTRIPKPKPSAEGSSCGTETWEHYFKAKLLPLLFAQCTPERRRTLAWEDGPQGVLASLYTVAQGANAFVIASSIGLPSMRFVTAWLAYPRLLLSRTLQDFLLREARLSRANGQTKKKSVYAKHLVAACFRESKVRPTYEDEAGDSFMPSNKLLVMASEALSGQGSMGSLNYANLQLDDKTSAELLMAAAADMPNVMTLSLRENVIEFQRAPQMVKALSGLLALESLDLDDNRLGPKGTAALAEALVSLERLQTLQLRSNNIGVQGAVTLAKVLPRLTTLSNLVLADNGIGPDGAVALANGLTGLQQIQKLNLQSNDIGAKGAAALATVLPALEALEELDLGSNDLGIEGAKAIAAGVAGMGHLRRLGLQSNSIFKPGASSLARVFPKLLSLQELILRDNCLGDSGVSALAVGLADLRQLRRLDLGKNSIRTTGALALTKTLPSLEELEELELDDNFLDAGSVAALAAGLSSMKRLHRLDLKLNSFNREDCEELLKVVPANCRTDTTERSDLLIQVESVLGWAKRMFHYGWERFCIFRCSPLGIFFLGRLLPMQDVGNDLLVTFCVDGFPLCSDVGLWWTDYCWWGSLSIFFVVLPFVLWWIWTTRSFMQAKAHRGRPRCLTLVQWTIFGLPCVLAYDLFMLLRFPFSHCTLPLLLEMSRIRALAEVVEAMLQTTLQVHIVFYTFSHRGAAVPWTLLYFVMTSAPNFAMNLVELKVAADAGQVTFLENIRDICWSRGAPLIHVLGHVPNIDYSGMGPLKHDHIEDIVHRCSSCPGLGSIKFGEDNGVTASFLRLVWPLLPGRESVEISSVMSFCSTRLVLRGNGLRAQDAYELAEVLPALIDLEELDFSDNNLGDEGAEAVLGSLVDLRRLRVLNLDRNGIGSDCRGQLQDALPAGCVLHCCTC